MPNNTIIQLKRTNSAGVAPTNLLANGEFAYNLADKRLFTTNTTGGAVFDAIQNTASNLAITGTTVQLFIGNSTVNLVSNSASVKITNSTSNSLLTPVSLFLGNSVANQFSNSITTIIANSTASITLTPTTIAVGNSTINLNFTGGALLVNAVMNVSSNAYFNSQFAIKVINLGIINSTSNNTINCATGNYFRGTIGGAVSVTFTSIPASDVGYGAILEFANVGTNITWASPNTKWAGASAPTFSSNTDIIVMLTRDNGTTIRMNLNQKDSR